MVVNMQPMNVSSGEVVMPYSGPDPAAGTDQHNIAFIALRQKGIVQVRYCTVHVDYLVALDTLWNVTPSGFWLAIKGIQPRLGEVQRATSRLLVPFGFGSQHKSMARVVDTQLGLLQ